MSGKGGKMRQVICFLMMIVPFFESFSRPILSLQEVLKSGKIKVKLIGTGAYQQDCLQLWIQNLGPDSLRLQLEAGTKFNSLTESEQDLLLTATPIIAMKAKGETRLMLRAFCCQASNRAPHSGGIYELASKQDSSLRKIARFMEPRNFAKDIVQHAIWTISDKHRLSSIPDSTEALQSLRVYLAQLSGQIIPWYHLDMRSGRSPSGRLWQSAKNLSATVIINNDKDEYVTLTVLDKDGLPCAKILQHWLKAGQQQRYTLEIPIASLAFGEYSIVLSTKTETLFRDKFVVEGMS
jgi:hypothetical protein